MYGSVSGVPHGGQSFHDLAGIPHTLFANAAHKPRKFLVAYTVKKGGGVIETP